MESVLLHTETAEQVALVRSAIGGAAVEERSSTAAPPVGPIADRTNLDGRSHLCYLSARYSELVLPT